ncbi:MAG: metallophosphatase family protein [Chloroflexota bacterium]|nr:metallophosphatase family protein [Chloroflexota bacterium]
MRIGIITDIHGNYVALRTVLQHMGNVDALWCLGDIVGYGPQPNECIEAISEYAHLCVPGNHDWGTLGRLDRQAFNRDARAILEWTLKELTPGNKEYLESLPLTLTAMTSSFTIVHASPRDPMWEYLLDLFDAAECFPLFHSRYCFVGHTHVPLIFRNVHGQVKAEVPEPGGRLRISSRPYKKGVEEPGWERMIVNPGSVGQPRDGDPRSAYMVLEVPDDTGSADPAGSSLTFVRVPYEIEETQALMRRLGFPARLVARLEQGI